MPAQALRLRFPPEISARIERLAWWDWPVERLADAIPDMQALPIEEFLDRWDRPLKPRLRGAPMPLGLTFQERREGFAVVGVPARQRRAVLDDVADGPGHAALVGLALGLVVGAEDVEIAARKALQHEVDDLFRRPRAGGLFLRAVGQPGVGEAGDQQMRGDLRARRVAQRVGEAFGVGLQRAFETL